MKRRVLVSAREATPASNQHKRPCSDCPWRRDSVNGWLGSLAAEQWIAAAHGEVRIDCHTKIGPQCAGSAIYRANVCKMPRHPQILVLPADRARVFTSPAEFRAHHVERTWDPHEHLQVATDTEEMPPASGEES